MEASELKEKAEAMDWLDRGIMAGRVQLDRQHRFDEGPAVIEVWDESKGWLFYFGETVLAAIQAAMQAETK